MKKKFLFAGPFVGEFGWELFTWQAYVRAQAKNYDHVTVCSRADKAFLYEDFADEFIPLFNVSKNNVSMFCSDNPIPASFTPPAPVVTWLDPYKILGPIRNIKKHDKTLSLVQTFMPDNQVFIKFGKSDINKKYDFIIHARNRTGTRSTSKKNWATENYIKFVSMFPEKTFASVGTIEEARHVPGTDDLRGIELRDLADVLASSSLMLGPSDGCINFGALCGIPRLVWTCSVDAEKNKDRHITSWNPFNIPARVFCCINGWSPTPGEVYRETIKFQTELK